jgi:hypothetical protein
MMLNLVSQIQYDKIHYVHFHKHPENVIYILDTIKIIQSFYVFGFKMA